MTGEIHEEEHPFATPEADRDPVRQMRGRLVAPVTVVTSGDDGIAGLTVSSIMLAEGDPGSVHFLLGPDTDLASAIRGTGSFVVHVLASTDRDLSEVFAGRRPSPGGPFAGLDVDRTEWGPVIARVGDRTFCSGATTTEHGYSLLVSANVDRVDVTDLDDPLVYFRGSYRHVG